MRTIARKGDETGFADSGVMASLNRNDANPVAISSLWGCNDDSVASTVRIDVFRSNAAGTTPTDQASEKMNVLSPTDPGTHAREWATPPTKTGNSVLLLGARQAVANWVMVRRWRGFPWAPLMVGGTQLLNIIETPLGATNQTRTIIFQDTWPERTPARAIRGRRGSRPGYWFHSDWRMGNDGVTTHKDRTGGTEFHMVQAADWDLAPDSFPVSAALLDTGTPQPDVLAALFGGWSQARAVMVQTIKGSPESAAPPPPTDVLANLFQPRDVKLTVAKEGPSFADVQTPDLLFPKSSQPVQPAGKPFSQTSWRSVDVPAPDIVQPKPQPVPPDGPPATQPRGFLLDIRFPDIVQVLVQPIIRVITKAMSSTPFADQQPAPPATEALTRVFQPPPKAVLTVAQVEKTLLNIPSPDVLLVRLAQIALGSKPPSQQMKFLDVQPVSAPDVLARLLQQVPKSAEISTRAEVRKLVSLVGVDVLRPISQRLQVRPDGTIYQPRMRTPIFLTIAFLGEGIYALITQADEVYALITQSGEIYADVSQAGELYALVTQDGEVYALVTQSGEIYALVMRRPN